MPIHLALYGRALDTMSLGWNLERAFMLHCGRAEQHFSGEWLPSV